MSWTVPGVISHHRALMSIEYIRVLNVHGDKPTVGGVYGTVNVQDFMGVHKVYDRSLVDFEKKGPGDDLTLIGPDRPCGVSGYDWSVISVNLRGVDPDIEIVQGDVVWETRVENRTFANYSKRLERVVTGKHGSAAVGFSVMEYALCATVTVVLLNHGQDGGEKPAHVYGTIKASQLIGGSSTSLTLFDKSSDECVEVYPKNDIVLTRSIVVVPLDDGITISVSLCDSNDREIAKGNVNFDSVYGPQTKTIYGSEHGEVEVSIFSA
ncbi:unnamed protein product [Cuscuta europaea]|uniref:DUF6598 domain-containing protein n=1 Tax=Cuscuta europaea TaxID=41803 RepID=A0A9P0YN02_CUSEU|nr:unnamed protein product [Cuscuta europaea]